MLRLLDILVRAIRQRYVFRRRGGRVLDPRVRQADEVDALLSVVLNPVRHVLLALLRLTPKVQYTHFVPILHKRIGQVADRCAYS